MPDTPNPQLIVELGLPESGAGWLSWLFSRSGLVARICERGALAQDVFHARATGRRPFAGWPNARLLGELVHRPPPPTPTLYAMREFRFLDAALPDARFVLPHRNPEEWVAALVRRADGFLAQEAAQRGLSEAALAEVWLAEAEAHAAAVRAHFAGSGRLVELDLERMGAGEVAEALAPWVALRPEGVPPPFGQPVTRARVLDKALARLAAPAALHAPGISGAERDLAESLARFGLGQTARHGGSLGKAHRSQLWARWNGASRVTDRSGAPHPFALADLGTGPRFVAPPGGYKRERIVGVINEVLDLGRARKLSLDMEDARFLGTGDKPAPPGPVLTFNRRAGARNLVLWPLPGYHSPGKLAYVSEVPVEAPDFADRAPVAVWRGNLSGWARLAPEGGRGRQAAQIYGPLAAAAPGSKEHAALLAELLSVPRIAIVRRLAGRPGFDLKLTPGARHRAAFEIAELAPHCTDRVPLAFFARYRYILSLAGNDTGSNFLTAANLGALVLKEEDGWEQFYTAAFRPWEHYVPLAPGATDAEEKLDWAQSHPAEAAAIAGNARELCRRIARPATRRAWLRLVAEGL